MFHGLDRIYLTESVGGVLGANVMRDHNVVFDHDRHLVGFAEGVCDYNAESLELPTKVDGKEVRVSRPRDTLYLCTR